MLKKNKVENDGEDDNRLVCNNYVMATDEKKLSIYKNTA